VVTRTSATKGTKFWFTNIRTLRVLRTTIVESFRSLRKCSIELKYSTRELTRAKAQSTPSSEGRDELSWRNSSPLFSDLCGLGVFARKIFLRDLRAFVVKTVFELRRSGAGIFVVNEIKVIVPGYPHGSLKSF
jgi:hypothetical protein